MTPERTDLLHSINEKDDTREIIICTHAHVQTHTHNYQRAHAVTARTRHWGTGPCCLALPESMAVQGRDLITAAMDPLPAHCVGVLITAYNGQAVSNRIKVAKAALLTVHGIDVPPDDLHFVFEKLEMCCPQMLRGVPAAEGHTPEVWPSMAACPKCRGPFSSHRREIPLHLYSQLQGKEKATAIELHCCSCDTFCLGHWSFKRQNRKKGVTPIIDLELQNPQNACHFILPTPGLHSAHGCSQHDLRLVTGVLHHARGSFHAAKEIFADVSKDERMHSDQNAHRVLEALWFAWALCEFLPPTALSTLDWSDYWDGRVGSDEWLCRLRAPVRARFLDKWLFQHIATCPSCSRCFGIGLDGKRGMKRYICACLDGPPRHVPEAGASLAQGCGRPAAYGSLYCHEHDYCVDDIDIDDEEVPTHILKHRSSEDGTLEYQVKIEPADPDDNSLRRHVWVPAAEVASSARRAYEHARLPEKGAKHKRRKERARTGGHMEHAVAAHVLAEDDADKGACEINKVVQGQMTKKWQRRRIGGIIAAVTGCRVFIDWEEHQFGEGTSNIYVVLAQLVSALLERSKEGLPSRMPDVVFFDNACALKKFACNPKRCDLTEVTRTMKELHYMIDIWHVTNHRACLQDPESARLLDPRSDFNSRTASLVNTEACEQGFSFMDRITYVGMNMGPGHFAIYLYLVLDLENAKVTRRR